jgi:hypothetical protein
VIDALASSPNYLRHLQPVWQAIPKSHRGTLYLGGQLCSPRCPPGARTVSVELQHRGPRVLVASDVDYRHVAGNRRVILMQHGAGQSYGGDPDPGVARHPSYAGGTGQERSDLFVVPGPHPACRTREQYPELPCVAVGCPALDARLRHPRVEGDEAPTVAITFHWNNQLCPETMSAFSHFAPVLSDLSRRFRVIGHAHPKAWSMTNEAYRAAGIPWVDYEAMLDQADVIVVDNSSAGFEAAALGIPVVWMTPPWYRDLDHGLRFGPERWLGGLGMEVREPADLIPAVAESVMIGHWRAGPVPDLHDVYTHLDGTSAARAAAGIVALEEERDPLGAVLEAVPA